MQLEGQAGALAGLDAVLGKLDELVRTETVRYTDVEPGGDGMGAR